MINKHFKMKIFPVTDEAELAQIRIALQTTADIFLTSTGLLVSVENLKSAPELQMMKLIHKLRFANMDEVMFLIKHFWKNVPTTIFLPTPEAYENQEQFNKMEIVQLSKSPIT